MLYGNQEALHILRTYIEHTIATGTGMQFFLLVGPSGIGKSAHAQALIQEILGPYAYSNFLYLQDHSTLMGKTHTIPIELNDYNEVIEGTDGSRHPNYGVRELNLRMQQSGFGSTKFVLIENIQRMSGSAINAFLKTSEEPLKNRFILATLPHQSQVLDTILSRAVVIHFSPVAESEMETFAQEKNLFAGDKGLQKMLIAMSMGKPGVLLRLSEQIALHPPLATTIKQLTTTLANATGSQTKKQQLLKQLAEVGLLQEFIDGRISYTTEQHLFPAAEKLLEVKRLMQSNVNQENLLWYGVLE